MLLFVARRLLYLVPVLLAVSLLTFLIASLLPGDLASTVLGDQATPENVAALRHDMGLDEPIWWRYLGWLGHVLEGDLGRSFRTGQTVLQAVAERLPVSFELMLFAQIIALAIGVPLAIVCAARSGGAVRSLHDRHRLRHAVGTGVSVRDSADLSVRGRAALAARDGLRPVHRRPRRQSAPLRAARADAWTRRMARHHARAALRHDRDPAGRLHHAGEGQGAEAVAHPVRACAETVVADADHHHRHQYRTPDWAGPSLSRRFLRCQESDGWWSARSGRAT